MGTAWGYYNKERMAMFGNDQCCGYAMEVVWEEGDKYILKCHICGDEIHGER